MAAVLSGNDFLRDAGSPTRRQVPRVHVELPVALVLTDGKVVRACTRDVSTLGVRIRTDRATAAAIRPGGRAIRAGEAPEVRLATALPDPAGPQKVVARCSLAHFQLNDDGTVEFGLEFLALPSASAQRLQRFVERSLEPAY